MWFADKLGPPPGAVKAKGGKLPPAQTMSQQLQSMGVATRQPEGQQARSGGQPKRPAPAPEQPKKKKGWF
jgi:hypothetical protein